MNRSEVLELLQLLRNGEVSVESAADKLSGLDIADLGHSRLDVLRELRSGLPEVIYAEGKTTDRLIDLLRETERRSGRALATRLRSDQIPALRAEFPDSLTIFEEGRAAVLKQQGAEPENIGSLAIVTAGTSDAPVAEEVKVSGRFLGVETSHFADVGVAGLPRLLRALPDIRQADVVIVIAGMEGALPSVVAGLVEAPVIAVPTSVGYGACFEGITALLGMLVSCSPGVTVVNIDNGFGAALAAVKIIRHLRRTTST